MFMVWALFFRCFDSTLVEIPVEVETPDHHYYHVWPFTHFLFAFSFTIFKFKCFFLLFLIAACIFHLKEGESYGRTYLGKCQIPVD